MLRPLLDLSCSFKSAGVMPRELCFCRPSFKTVTSAAATAVYVADLSKTGTGVCATTVYIVDLHLKQAVVCQLPLHQSAIPNGPGAWMMLGGV